jgi:hypothetical protein
VTSESLSGTCFKSIAVLPDSGIGATRVRPDELTLEVPQQPIVAVAGHRSLLRFGVTRRGGRPDIGATIQARFPSDFEPVNGSAHRFNRLGTTKIGELAFVAHTPGHYAVSIGVSGQYNQPNATIAVNVVPPQSWFKTRFLPALITAAFIIAAAALTFASRRRER